MRAFNRSKTIERIMNLCPFVCDEVELLDYLPLTDAEVDAMSDREVIDYISVYCM